MSGINSCSSAGGNGVLDILAGWEAGSPAGASVQPRDLAERDGRCAVSLRACWFILAPRRGLARRAARAEKPLLTAGALAVRPGFHNKPHAILPQNQQFRISMDPLLRTSQVILPTESRDAAIGVPDAPTEPRREPL